MSEDKKTTNTAKAVDKVEVVKRTPEELSAEDTQSTTGVTQKDKKSLEPELKDGIYTEEGVELANGRKVDVGVIVDRKKLPATYGSLLAEGNGPALVIASLTVQTRRMIDMAGATLEDLEEVLADVIDRSRDAAESEGEDD